jgi:hypothetical protein
MFAQLLIYIFLILGFAWAVWKLIIIPVLKEKGIDYEEKKTEYMVMRDALKEKYELMEMSAQAADEGVELAREIRYWEDRIADAEKRMKEV